ncbi:nuclear transcription factor Y subunit A-7-like [Iris pallida]|uniref:Nuclear transcription factor Y subunit n=1 Tax=Iris pallida TaxID=29817 RepID=A0AAX6I4T4_IRIPA|nr:nuclear transcription factor Y subunit A-7-like [Iris pallida]KAJ6848239.1 nuclear transcription factor Y subunit A-7-like [Iris pallida]
MPSDIVRGFDMQNISNKDSEKNPIYPTANCVNSCPSWWTSTASPLPKSYPKHSNMTIDTLGQHGNQLKHLGHQMLAQDSSSSQSTDQAHQELSGISEGNLQEQCVSTQSGNDSTYENHVQGHMKSALSLVTPETVLQHPQLNYNPTIACFPYPYADPYYGGVLAPYGSHAIIHPQMVGMGVPTSSRVPLPHELAEEEPMYVNAKQFHAILRRRELRAKQEAQNKLIKGRKPYLHESRHAHAMKRARGVGGRFLNTKKLEEQAQLLENGGTVGSTATSACSEVTSVSNGGGGGGFIKTDHLRFSSDAGDFHHIRGNTQGGSGAQHRVPVMR